MCPYPCLGCLLSSVFHLLCFTNKLSWFLPWCILNSFLSRTGYPRAWQRLFPCRHLLHEALQVLVTVIQLSPGTHTFRNEIAEKVSKYDWQPAVHKVEYKSKDCTIPLKGFQQLSCNCKLDFLHICWHILKYRESKFYLPSVKTRIEITLNISLRFCGTQFKKTKQNTD